MGNTGGSEPTLSNAVRIAGASEITAAPVTLFRINGNLSGSGALSLAGIFNGAGLRLAGNNAGFTGSATVTGANPRLGATTSGSAAAAWIVDGNLQTDVVGGGSFQFDSLAGGGRLDLGGEVNVFDLVSINGAGRYGSGQSADWSQGDFNYDGVTNVFDLVGINTATASGQGSYLPAAAASAILGAAAVPEPWATLPGCLAALWLARGLTRRS